ncbi:hypothetical protein HK103_003724 [Boothiomyces macroporosus]|uniref:Cytochrome b561 domain-containing protein n=1 Tax=Boothiomyces macroporosus TaxID=261099 RepID=A0AAD5UHE4_9FUNG|nr:hypothetical protein HK103_003724 [Boothiomyces macroporosus]
MRPISSVDVTLASTSSYIYALGQYPPKRNIDNPATRILEHYDKGLFDVLDFVDKPTTSTPTLAPTGNPTSPSIVGKCVGSSICIYGQPDGSGNVVVTVHSSAPGYTGIGIGSSMINSTDIIVWRNSTGGFTISDRYATDYVSPSVSESQVSKIVPLQFPGPSWSNMSFSFSRPILAPDVNITSSSSWIYALGQLPPKRNIDNPGSRILEHYDKGFFDVLDFVDKPASTTTLIPTTTASSVPTSSPTPALPGTCVGTSFCIFGKPDGKGNIMFTVHSAAKGWTGVGADSATMIGSKDVVVWKNSTGGYTISDRIATADSLPGLSSNPASKLIPLQIPAPDWATMAFSYIRPIVSADYTITSNTQWLYAFGNFVPAGNIDDPGATFRSHGRNKGQLGALNFVGGTTIPATTSSSPSTQTSSPSATPVANGNNGICVGEQYCIYGENDKQGNIIFTVHSALEGWAAIGTGTGMDNSAITVGWKNSNGGYTLSDRVSKDFVMPVPSGDVISKIVPLRVPLPSWAALGFSFSKPIQNRDVTFTSSTSYIYAHCQTPPKSPDTANSDFSSHAANGAGVIGQFDFLSSNPSTVTRTIPIPTIIPTPTIIPVPSGGGTGLSTSVCIPNQYCIYGEPDGNGNTLITIHSSANGWVGVGIGSSMMNAKMIIGWLNNAGQATISDRSSKGEVMPTVSSPISTLVALQHAAPSWANIAFTVSLKSADGPITSTTQYIYAYSDSRPSNPDSASSDFPVHTVRGQFGVLDFTTKNGGTVAVTTPGLTPGSPGVVNGGVGSTCIPDLYCVYSEPDGSGNVYITLLSAASGWVGLGTGRGMASSSMIVGWKNSQGKYVVSDRKSSGEVMPTMSNQVSKLVDLRVTVPSWANLAFTVLKPLKSADFTFTPQTDFIYAYSSSAPSDPTSSASSFPVHTGRGYLGVLDFTTKHAGTGTAGQSNGSNAPPNKVDNGVGSTCIPNLYCVYSAPDGKGNVYISLLSAAGGWVALGTGKGMASSSMIVGWQSSQGKYVVSSRVSSSEILPPMGTQVATVVDLKVPQPDWAKLAFTVLVPLKSTDYSFTAQSEFIYAYSTSAPSNPDLPSSNFNIHTGRGYLGVLDFTTFHNGTGSQSSGGNPSNGGNPSTPPPNNGLIGSTCVQGTYCVYSEPDGAGNVYITLHGSYNGWVALGTSTSMTGSAMIVAWKNSKGGYTVSDRISQSEILPQPSTETYSVVVDLRVNAPSWAKLAVTIKRPLSTNDITYKTDTQFIYALSDTAPSNPDDPTSTFSIHDKFGKLGNLDFTTYHSGTGNANGGGNSILTLPDGVEYSTVIRLHGYVMLYAWVFCPFIGVFIARYLKDYLGVWWFRLHVLIMLFGCALGSVSAVLLIFLFKTGEHFTASPSLHPLLGLLVTIAMVCQVVLGFVSDRLFSMDRTEIPWWDKAHWYLGRGLAVAALITIITGIVYSDYFASYALALPVLFGLLLAGGMGLFVYGETKIGQIHHMKDDSVSEEGIVEKKDTDPTQQDINSEVNLEPRVEIQEHS